MRYIRLAVGLVATMLSRLIVGVNTEQDMQSVLSSIEWVGCTSDTMTAYEHVGVERIVIGQSGPNATGGAPSVFKRDSFKHLIVLARAALGPSGSMSAA